MRLDVYLVESGLFESRNRAIETIKRGKVFINGRVAKPSTLCDNSSDIFIEEEKFLVSRSAKKLELFFEDYPMNVKDKIALDIGSSTGGFSQILLEKGVESVDCVDVGKEQLHNFIKTNPKVRSFEGQDIRDFISDRRYNLIVSDVSFISLLYILESVDRLADSDCDIILLFKPQFEVGKEVSRDSKGVVKDQKAIINAQERFEQSVKKIGWRLIFCCNSRLSGKSGNIEIIYYLKKGL